MMSFLSGFVGSSDRPEELLYLPEPTHSLSCFIFDALGLLLSRDGDGPGRDN